MSISGYYYMVPLVPQQHNYDCGCASTNSLAQYYGEEKIPQDEMIELLHATPRRGTPYKEIIKFLKTLDYVVLTKEPLLIKDIYDCLDNGLVILTCIQAWAPGKNVDYKNVKNNSHYTLIIGYDKENIIFMDPGTKNSYTYLPLNEFKIRFRDDAGKSGGLVIIGDSKHKKNKIDIKTMKKMP